MRLRPEVLRVISASSKLQRNQMVFLVVLHISVSISIGDNATLLESVRIGDRWSKLFGASAVADFINAFGSDSAGSAGWVWQAIETLALCGT